MPYNRCRTCRGSIRRHTLLMEAAGATLVDMQDGGKEMDDVMKELQKVYHGVRFGDSVP